MPNSTTETPSSYRSEADQVGTQDLFHDEDVEYARGLSDSDVPCHLDVIPGAFHGLDLMFPKTEIAREFWRRQARALKNASASNVGGRPTESTWNPRPGRPAE